MADIMTSTSGYATGAIDSASTLVNNVSTTDAAQPNGIASACVQIETILGLGTTLKGSAADLVARLAVLLNASGTIKDTTGATTYTKWDGWAGYTSTSLKKKGNWRMPGEIIMWPMTAIPSGWLECDGQTINCTTYIDLFELAVAEVDLAGGTIGWERGTAAHTLPQATDIDVGTDTLTEVGHGLTNGTVVHLSSSVTMPTGLATRTVYYIVGATANTYQLSLTSGGSAVDITAVGSGTLSVYTTFNVPDYRGRSPLGAGTGSGLTARTLNAAVGAETHTLTEAEMPAHGNHVIAGTLGFGAAGSITQVGGTKGGGDPHNNMQPSFGIKYLVRT